MDVIGFVLLSVVVARLMITLAGSSVRVINQFERGVVFRFGRLLRRPARSRG